MEYLEEAQSKEAAEEMKNVYITDHSAPVRKYNTTSDEEDLQYFNYMQTL